MDNMTGKFRTPEKKYLLPQYFFLVMVVNMTQDIRMPKKKDLLPLYYLLVMMDNFKMSKKKLPSPVSVAFCSKQARLLGNFFDTHTRYVDMLEPRPQST